MTASKMDPSDLVTIPAKWDFEYVYFAGEAASRFFREIMSSGRIFGTRCPSCERVLVPARSFCDACYVATNEWVEVGPGGTLEIFTIVATKFPGLPDPPFVIGYVTLDGADTAMANRVTGVNLDDPDRAALALMRHPRIKICFKDQREGRITDFHFELVDLR